MHVTDSHPIMHDARCDLIQAGSNALGLAANPCAPYLQLQQCKVAADAGARPS